MNATINSATGVSPHYTITIGLPKLHKKEIVSDDPRAYSMQINALLKQVDHHLTLANDEADLKMEARSYCLTYKDPIKVGDKVLIHWPQSTMAQSSHLPWIEFTVVKTNEMMSQVENENSDKTWIHCIHICCLAS